MSYFDLGCRQLTGKAGVLSNPFGATNWTAQFTPTDLTVSVPFEVYHIYVDGPPGSTFKIYRNTFAWDNVPNGSSNSWDPAQPMPVRPGDTVNVYYNTGTPPAPVVTLWLRTLE